MDNHTNLCNKAIAEELLQRFKAKLHSCKGLIISINDMKSKTSELEVRFKQTRSEIFELCDMLHDNRREWVKQLLGSDDESKDVSHNNINQQAIAEVSTTNTSEESGATKRVKSYCDIEEIEDLTKCSPTMADAAKDGDPPNRFHDVKKFLKQTGLDESTTAI
jgi:hypothetical protein